MQFSMCYAKDVLGEPYERDFPAWSTVYGYFWRWSAYGTWLKVHDKLYQWTRVAAGREPTPSEAVVDSQSVETATMIATEVGYDAGKQIHGRKPILFG
jgi:putative transposase